MNDTERRHIDKLISIKSAHAAIVADLKTLRTERPDLGQVTTAVRCIESQEFPKLIDAAVEHIQVDAAARERS